VGCVFVAVAGPGGFHDEDDGSDESGESGESGEDDEGVVVERHDLAGDRAQVRGGAVEAVLALLARRLPRTGPRPAPEGSPPAAC
jgi:hypothetical protein